MRRDGRTERPGPVAAAGPGTDGAASGEGGVPAAAEPGLLGFIDVAKGNRIAGWAMDRARPEAAVTVELRQGGTRLAALAADRYRKDLDKPGLGGGRHGFELLLAAPLGEGEAAGLTGVVRGEDGLVVPLVNRLAPAAEPAPPPTGSVPDPGPPPAVVPDPAPDAPARATLPATVGARALAAGPSAVGETPRPERRTARAGPAAGPDDGAARAGHDDAGTPAAPVALEALRRELAPLLADLADRLGELTERLEAVELGQTRLEAALARLGAGRPGAAGGEAPAGGRGLTLAVGLLGLVSTAALALGLWSFFFRPG